MANKRIKDLSTTAAVTASDDFIAVDGATNGTRKLDAYSPTFGGNLTVSGATRVSDGTAAAPSISLSSATTTGFYKYNASVLGFSSSGSHSFLFGYDGTIYGANLASTLSMPAAGGVTLTAGGTNQNITLTPSGTGTNVLNKGLSVLNTIGQFSGTGAPASGAGVEVGMLGTTQGLIFAYNRTTSAALPLSLQHAGGNLLLGTTTDGGQKLQVSGTAYVSGDATFAGDLYGTTNLVLNATSGTNGNVYLRAKGTGYVRIDTGSGFRVETGKVNFSSLPTSSTGLSAGDLWVDTSAGNVVKRV